MRFNMLAILVFVCSGCTSKKEVVERYPDGSVKRQIVHMGRDEYYEEEYYGNGKLKKETLFKNGLKDSVMTEYFEDGGKGGEMTFRNGVRNGVTHEFYRNAQMAFEGFCVDGKFEGLSTWYYRNGKIQEKGYRHLDLDTGRWVFYDTTGALTRAVEYHQNARTVYYDGAGIEISADEWQKIPSFDQAR